jgi:hypothetical protein
VNKLLVLAAPLALALCACSGIDHATLDSVTTTPDDSTVTLRGAYMRSGVAAAFKPRVWTHDFWGKHEQNDGIDVETSDASIIRVAHVTDDKRVVVWAVGPGSATLTITLDGETATNIPVLVTDPP